jgi:hypothetical protein
MRNPTENFECCEYNWREIFARHLETIDQSQIVNLSVYVETSTTNSPDYFLMWKTLFWRDDNEGADKNFKQWYLLNKEW